MTFTEKLRASKEAAQKADIVLIKHTDPEVDLQNNLKRVLNYCDIVTPAFTLELIERHEALEGKLEQYEKALEHIAKDQYVRTESLHDPDVYLYEFIQMKTGIRS